MPYPPTPAELDVAHWSHFLYPDLHLPDFPSQDDQTYLHPGLHLRDPSCQPRLPAFNESFPTSSIQPSMLFGDAYLEDGLTFGTPSDFPHRALASLSPAELSPSSGSESQSLSPKATSSSCQSSSIALPTLTNLLPKVETDDEGSEYNDPGDSEDDEYVPSSSSRKRRRRTSLSRGYETNSPLLRNRSTRPLPRNSGPPPQKKHRTAPPSRHTQAEGATSSAILKAVKSHDGAGSNFKCPECGYLQNNRRMPDYKRHLRTHIRPSNTDESNGWWCKGILFDAFLRLPEKDQTRIRNRCNKGEPFTFGGKLRIGGCRSTFSRRDALKRHLSNAKSSCVGRACGATED
ncbi:hypothetical protein FA15DRAFT_665716 [Coprinopsis marcescibilis]|uniref:Uncharacterized protein n=1 Tax=Coprinopsis marcescibilis TaxID=230819 RepID=A0A5C3L598_COPMA|nr:hypothetical protein FA15DRAFT_665716 [Coprinopsis marcescibilis]